MNLLENPELRRNLWLELTPQRLLGMPLVLAAFFLLIYMLDDYTFGEGVANAALTLFCLLALLWGTRQAAETIVSEIRDHTWDSQRMSVVGPWAMTWGKLLGSTVYPWYGALICLLVYIAATPAASATSLVKAVATLLAAGLFSQAIALLSSLQAIRKDRRYSRSQAAAFLVLGIGLGMPLVSTAFADAVPFTWYGMQLDARDFALASLLIFLFWALVAIARLLRAELQMRSYPHVWVLFVLFVMAYVGGFLPGEQASSISLWLWSAAAVAATLTYGMLFSERKDPVAFRRLLQAWQGGAWREVACHLPLWLTTLPLVAASVVALVVVDLAGGAAELGDERLGIVVAAAFFFLLRDVGLLLHANLGANPRRADMVTVLYLTMLYGVVPGIFAMLDLDALTAFFWPRTDLSPLLVVIAPLAEALLVATLVVRRWRSHFGRSE
jgi:hypothetical protein